MQTFLVNSRDVECAAITCLKRAQFIKVMGSCHILLQVRKYYVNSITIIEEAKSLKYH